MNEKPGLEPGFFCSTSCWRLDGLRVAPGADDMLVVPPRGWYSQLGSERSPGSSHIIGGLIVSTSNRHDSAI
jgi:hypothetical protein